MFLHPSPGPAVSCGGHPAAGYLLWNPTHFFPDGLFCFYFADWCSELRAGLLILQGNIRMGLGGAVWRWLVSPLTSLAIKYQVSPLSQPYWLEADRGAETLSR